MWRTGRPAISGIGDYLLLQLLAETGTELKAWPTEHFNAWLGLAPGSRQSGKRKGSVKVQRNRAGRLFCAGARSLVNSVDKALGGFYRRLAARKGGLVALKALARKLAELYYRVLRHGLAYAEQGLRAYEQSTQTASAGCSANWRPSKASSWSRSNCKHHLPEALHELQITAFQREVTGQG